MAGLEDFGHEVRQWLAENCPQSMRKPIEDDSDIYWGGRQASFKSDDQRDWFERMAARGWTVPAWSKEYGGGGLGKEEAKVLQQEMRRIKARIPLQSF
ncbi:MAG: acyl-CoA dehydrogenase, partial [Alphaproteobacteria bacterium]